MGIQKEKPLRVQGTYAAMITPFDANGKLDKGMARDMVEFFKEKGLDGIFAVSNIGEFAAITLEERMELTTLCCEQAAGALAVCPGVSDFDIATALRLARHAADAGANAVVLSAPLYYPYSNEYVEAYIRCFLEESPLPVIFYYSPLFARPVEFSFLLDIIAHPKVVAVKESSGDILFLQRLLEGRAVRGLALPVMLGWEELLLDGLVNGAQGGITSCGGIVPELMTGIVYSYQAGDIAKARAMQRAVCRITDAVKGFGFPHGYKIAMAARGFNFAIVKSGLPTLEENFRAEVPRVQALLLQELAVFGLQL